MRTNAADRARPRSAVGPVIPSGTGIERTTTVNATATVNAKEIGSAKESDRRAVSAIRSVKENAIAIGRRSEMERMAGPLEAAVEEAEAADVGTGAATQTRTLAPIGRWQNVWGCEMDFSF